MAFYDDKDENELNQQQQAQAQNGVETSKPSGDIGGVPGNAGSTQAQAASSKPDNPGNFVGISQYLNANKNQAAKLGDQTAGVINNSADQARQGVAQLKSSFDKDVGSPLQVDQQAIDALNRGQVDSLNNDQKQNLKTQASVQYKGPKDLTDEAGYSNANQSLMKAQQNIDSANTEQGRMGLVKNINNGYRNKGIDTFDNALLQSGSGREKVEQAAQANRDLKQVDLGKEGLAAQQKAADVANSYQNANQTVQGAIQGANQNFQTNVNRKLQDSIAKALGTNNRITPDITDHELNQETLDLSGLKEGQGLFNLNLGDYFTPADINKINVGNIASKDDYAKYAALADLAGVPADQMFLNPNNASQAETAIQGPSFDKNKLAQDIQGKKSQYERDYASNTNFLPSKNIGLVDANGKSFDSYTPQQIEALIPEVKKNISMSSGMKKLYDKLNDKLMSWKAQSGINDLIKLGPGQAPTDKWKDAADSKKELADNGNPAASNPYAQIKKLLKG